MSTNKQFNFRKAGESDIKVVKDMIQELADFEKMGNGPQLTEEDLIRDAGINGGQEYCHIYVLDFIEEEKTTVIGYAICFFNYSTWQGKSYFLEDIYVRPAYRGIGAGARLFSEVAARANEYNCKRLDFHVLSWNPALNFYKKLGAINMTEAENWHFYRLHEKDIKNLVKNISKE